VIINFRKIYFYFILFFPFISSVISAKSLIIENKVYGKVYLVDEITSDTILLGNVISPVKDINPFLFEASKWGRDFSVVASSVNGLHIKLFTFFESKSKEPIGAAGFSINPKEISSQYSIQTDIPAGTEIFLKNAPPVNSLIFIRDENGKIINRKFININDSIVIKYFEPKNYTIRFENCKGGGIFFENDKKYHKIGSVIQPIKGIGRFPGTKYAPSSSVRANHPGVICISTSPLGEIGGFQIIPYEHSQEPELKYVPNNPAYMIVKIDNNKKTVGSTPLFADYIIPGDTVLFNFSNGEIKECPKFIGKIDDAFTSPILSKIFNSNTPVFLKEIIISNERNITRKFAKN